MKKTLNGIKAAFLLAALIIVAWSATAIPRTASAAECEGYGHSCHGQTADGTIIHSKEKEAY